MSSPHPSSALRGRRILVVEDDFLLAEDIHEELEKRGAEVLGPVAQVGAALSLLSEDRPDAAVLDVNLGGELVFPVAEALMSRGVPFVFLTGYDRSVLPTAFDHVDCCEKPLKIDALCQALAGREAQG